MDTEDALKAIRGGTVAAGICAATTLLIAVIASNTQSARLDYFAGGLAVHRGCRGCRARVRYLLPFTDCSSADGRVLRHRQVDPVSGDQGNQGFLHLCFVFVFFCQGSAWHIRLPAAAPGGRSFVPAGMEVADPARRAPRSVAGSQHRLCGPDPGRSVDAKPCHPRSRHGAGRSGHPALE